MPQQTGTNLKERMNMRSFFVSLINSFNHAPILYVHFILLKHD